MLQTLPPHLASLLPVDVVLCHHERSDDASYDLWIFSGPTRELLAIPENLPEHQRRRLPVGVLTRILDRATSWLDIGQPEGDQCTFTRWHHVESDYQIREMLTTRGWYATVERFAHAEDPSVAS